MQFQYQLSRQTRKDPSQTARIRKNFADSIIRAFKSHAADAGELYTRFGRILNKHLRQGYLAGQIHAALVLKQYKTPFKPVMSDEEGLSNIIANAQITLEQLLDGSYQPAVSIITVLTTRLISAFNRGIVDFSRLNGTTTFQYLTAAGCSEECNIEMGVFYTLADISAGRCPPIHEGCLCILVPVR